MPTVTPIPITDPSDPRLALYRHVADPSALNREGLFVAEGRLVVERLIEGGRFAVESVAATPAAAAALEHLLEAHAHVTVHVCDPAVLEAVTGHDFHRGCLALARRPASEPALAAFASESRLLALEGVANPDNVGGLFRVALALGAGGVLLDPASGDPLYRKAIRTSMAASLRLPFTRVAQWPSALDELKAAGFRVVALTPDPGAMSIDDYVVERGCRLILALGSEGTGLKVESMRYADVRLRIPIDPRADSLNVVVAAGIALNRLLVR
jgi:tRNA G18 (ribose-2'-O)-methylase SpoU